MKFSKENVHGKNYLFVSLITGLLLVTSLLFILPANARDMVHDPEIKNMVERDEQEPLAPDGVNNSATMRGETAVSQPQSSPDISGPFVTQSIYPATRNMGDVSETRPLLQNNGDEIRQGEQSDSTNSEEESSANPSSRQPAQISSMTTATVNFEGLDFTQWGTGWPPDPNGDVGPNHFIQTVNTSIGIFDKAGNQLKAVTFNEFFDGTDTPCDAHGKGDPIVLYDALADRWLITEMSWQHDTGPYYQCLALSASGDPLGDWYQWGYLISYARWNDYSKMGVWDDGYYLTSNMFHYFSSDRENVRVIAFDRTSMLAGGPMRAIYFDLMDYNSTNYYSNLLPANLRGPLPPDGSPAYFAAIKDNNNTGPLRIWEFQADWDTPENSTFTGPTNVNVPFFATNINCWGSSNRECIPQPDTSKGLATIDNKLMMQLQYRNFGGHESLWANHTVDADSGRDLAGVRWYEVRDPGGSPTIHQSGTQGGFAGDLTERWMASLAVDGQGNMAVGYSASSNTLYPSIRYAGRLATDPAGTLQQEVTMTLGSGSQASTHRWGDYTSTTIDPVDDCTFWHTNEYYTETNASLGRWQTRVGAFKFDECTSNSLYGSITDASTTETIAEAQVKATNQSLDTMYLRTSAADGGYQMPIPAATYTVTASAYGYQPNTVTAVIANDTQVNIPLTATSFYDLSGAVTDAKTGYPLSARIFVLGSPVNPPAPANQVWSDSIDGSYGLNLSSGISYTLLIEADGYESKQLVFGQLTSNTTQNITLSPDLIGCTAAGYEFVGLKEDFETWPPPNWTIIDYLSNGLVWDWNGGDGGHSDFLDGNYTGGSGFAATVNSDRNGSTAYRTALVTPHLDFNTIPTTTLTYRLNYQDGSSAADGDRLDVSINLNDGTGWHRERRFTSDQNTWDVYRTTDATDSIDLSAYAGETDVSISWYYNTYRTPPNWYAQIDEVRLGVCQPISDTVLLEPEQITTEGCSGKPQTHTVTFINHSGSDDTATIGYTTSPSVTVHAIPTTLGNIPNGGSASFDVVASIDGCMSAGNTAITVTAVLENAPAYTDVTTITQRAIATAWEPVTGPLKPRSDQAFIATDAYLYQIGGTSSTRSEGSARYVYRYDPDDNSWLTMTPVITPVRRIDGAAIDNDIYILGGLAYDDGSGEYTDRYVQIYDEDTDSWRSGTPATAYRSAYAAVAVGNSIYRIGGKPRLSGASTTVDVYDTIADSWNNPTDPADYSWSVVWPCAGEIDGKIYVAGGSDLTVDRSETAVYDPAMNSWNDGAMADLPVTLYGAADFVLDGKLYCAGGVQDGEVSASVWAYDPIGDEWTREGDLSDARYRLEGDVLGGAGYAENGWDPYYSYSTAALDRTTSCDSCLAIEKSVTPVTGIPGEPITYTLTFSNTGGGIARGVVITDIIPISVTTVSVSSNIPITQHTGTAYVWDIGEMGCNSGIITVTGILSSPLATGMFTNTAVIDSENSISPISSNAVGFTILNAPPIALPDAYTTTQGIPLAITASGVLSNDMDANGDVLTAVLSDTVNDGLLALSPDGGFIYTPTTDFCGTDGFTYQADDETAVSNAVTVTLNISCLYTLTVTLDGAGSGAVNLDPPDINCTDDCSEMYLPGTTVTLTATADTGSIFAGWSGACNASSGDCVVTMNDEQTVTATFEPLPIADLAISQSLLHDSPDIIFTIVAQNSGADAAPGAIVSVTFPVEITNISWDCSASGGAVCLHTSGIGNLIYETVDTFPNGGVVTYTVKMRVNNGNIYTNTAEIIPPSAVSDPDLSNNYSEQVTGYLLFLPIILNADPSTP